MTIDENLKNFKGLEKIASKNNIFMPKLLWIHTQIAMNYSLDEYKDPRPLQKHYDLSYQYISINIERIKEKYKLGE